MRAIDLCQREEVSIAVSPTRTKPVMAYRYQEFGVHQFNSDMFEDWRVTHLPTGFLVGRGFPTAEDGAEAAVALAKLRNDWAIIVEEDLSPKLRQQVDEILQRHGGQLRAGGHGIKVEPRLNGYSSAKYL